MGKMIARYCKLQIKLSLNWGGKLYSMVFVPQLSCFEPRDNEGDLGPQKCGGIGAVPRLLVVPRFCS
ncbi:Uncharacterized protein HZ326_24804 [Fusarium oxysporum f. sp. albedinis]|nr:Uncharacterized protein HZ326_24804 [Fusarium oxysporum f. sp. albedinis]